MEEVVKEMLEVVRSVVHYIGATPEGDELIDDYAAIIGKTYRALTDKQDIPPGIAANCLENVLKSAVKK